MIRSLDAAKGIVRECCAAAFWKDHFHLFALKWPKFEVFYQTGEFAGWCSSLRKTEMLWAQLCTDVFFGQFWFAGGKILKRLTIWNSPKEKSGIALDKEAVDTALAWHMCMCGNTGDPLVPCCFLQDLSYVTATTSLGIVLVAAAPSLTFNIRWEGIFGNRGFSVLILMN